MPSRLLPSGKQTRWQTRNPLPYTCSVSERRSRLAIQISRGGSWVIRSATLFEVDKPILKPHSMMDNKKNTYQNGFRRLGANPPSAEDSEHAYPPHEWGTPAMRGENREGTIHLRAVRDSEGLIVISCCAECGGRHETLLPFATSRGLVTPEALASMPLVCSTTREFIESHRCPAAGYREGPKMRALIQSVLNRAKRTLRKGRQLAPSLWLLTSGGSLRVDLKPVYTIEDQDQRRIALARFKLAARQEVRSRGLAMKAAVAISEGWKAPEEDGIPSLSKRRQETALLVVSTAEYGFAKNYPIKRDSGIPDLGPGTLGEPFEHSLVESRLVDGLFGDSAPPALDRT